MLRGVMHMLVREPVKREPVVHGPVWLWDPEIEAYILVIEDVPWTEGSGPAPIALPPDN